MLFEQLREEMGRSSTIYQPSEIERIVIALVTIAETPILALSLISNDAQRFAAMNKMIGLGFIEYSDDGVILSDAGNELAIQQALVDDMNQPTENATQLASSISGDNNDQV